MAGAAGADLFIRRPLRRPARVADLRPEDAGDIPKRGLDTPKTACGKNRFL
jgi:hypothetical protein